MTTTPSPAPAPGRKKPWRKSEAPGHTPKHAPQPKEGAGEKVKKVLGATRDAVSRASDAVEKGKLSDVTSGVSGAVSSIGKKHKRKIWAAIGLAAALGAAKLGTTGYDAVQDYRRAGVTEKANETPRENITLPVIIFVKDEKVKVLGTSMTGKMTQTDDCGKPHGFTIDTGSADTMRKGRMRLPRDKITITVTAHGQTHTYEADEDIVADGEERESTIGAHLVSGEETHE